MKSVRNILSFVFLFILIPAAMIRPQIYPDQKSVIYIDSIYAGFESSEGVKLSDDGKNIVLNDGVTEGYFILKPQSVSQYFNQGLPSYNGKAGGEESAFKVQMRFPYGSTWSPWLTVGYWKNNIWSSYGTTSYGGGLVDVDYVKLNSYSKSWQFKVILKRTSADKPSPSLHKLGFFVSDSRTTSNVNINQLVNDNPAPVFQPTTFIYQYGVDPNIGGDICSPTSVSMVLKSFSIDVNPRDFALATYDPYWELFGVWPRVVQNASEYGLDGTVTRYRSWSEARAVLAAGGRIVMSIGQPLYAGHLLMLAGFTSDGKPIVHDPGKSAGYSYVYNKTDLSTAWFAKGGISYTFFPEGNVPSSADENEKGNLTPQGYRLQQNYPNPFNPETTITYSVPVTGFVNLSVYNPMGEMVKVLVNNVVDAGTHSVNFDADELSSGVYIYRLTTESFTESLKMNLLR